MYSEINDGSDIESIWYLILKGTWVSLEYLYLAKYFRRRHVAIFQNNNLTAISTETSHLGAKLNSPKLVAAFYQFQTNLSDVLNNGPPPAFVFAILMVRLN
jgi:hypothetical protein